MESKGEVSLRGISGLESCHSGTEYLNEGKQGVNREGAGLGSRDWKMVCSALWRMFLKCLIGQSYEGIPLAAEDVWKSEERSG